MNEKSSLRYDFDVFRLEPQERLLLRNGKPIPLTPKAFETLLVLIETRGHLVEKDELLRRVWPDAFVAEATLAQNISTLRHALGDERESGARYIETVPKSGYRFIAPVQVSFAESSQVAAAVEAPRAAWRSRTLVLPWAVSVGAALLLVVVYSAWRHYAIHVRPPTGRIMLAVLPFENLSGDPAQSYFSDGLTEEMITQLGGLNPERLGIIARTSAMHYKGTSEMAGQIGRELGVNYLLEGSVQREGTRVRISAQLIRAHDDTHLWARDYDGDVRDFLALERDVARDIASQIELKLAPQSAAHSARTVNPEAYEDYLKGRFFWNKRTDDGLRNAIDYFDDAVRKDPTYAEAYAGLADSYTLLGMWGMPGQDAWRHAKVAAGKALELDEGLAEAHASLGYIAMAYEWDWKMAEREFQHAIKLNPNYAAAHHGYGYCLMANGRLDEAAGELKQAQELDPLSMWIDANVGFRLYFARQYDQAIEQWRRVLQMDPNFPLVHSYLALAYEQKGLYKEAVEEDEKAIALGGSPTNIAALGHVYGVMGRPEEARKQLRKLHDLSKRTFVPAFYIAYVYVGLGDADQAFNWLDKACQEHSGYLVDLKEDPSFDRIRADPRFAKLLQRLNFTP